MHSYYFLFVVCMTCHAQDSKMVQVESSSNMPILDPLPLGSYVNFKTLEKPFRMAKLNILWSKAQLRLTDTKLKSLYNELKIHDKEELQWKKIKSNNGDKDGLKEANMRSKLTGIMSSYGLLHHFEEIHDPSTLKDYQFKNHHDRPNTLLFEDQRLNHLWSKAESGGFTAEELQALKEEFNHHQEKIDQYYSILNHIESRNDDHKNSVADDLDSFNALVEDDTTKTFEERSKRLRDLHHDVKDGYDRLYRITAKAPNSQEFIEPQVQGLWKLAVNANFSEQELLSLKSELLHYENRLLKLRHLHAEAAAVDQKLILKKAHEKNLVSEGAQLLEDNLKKSIRKVEKLRNDLETRIMQRHIEL